MDTNEWITLIAAVGALGAAIAAWSAAHETKRALQGQLLINVTDAYMRPEILNAMRGLRRLWREYPTEFAKKFLEQLNSGSDNGNSLNHSRRIVSHHFLKIFRLRKLEFVDDTFVRELAPPDEARFLFEVIEPLEQIINQNYDPSMFDMFRKLYPDLSRTGHIA